MKTLLSAAEIETGVERLAGEVTDCYGASPVTIVGVLTGCVVLLADLIRRLEMPLRVDFMQASSYRGGTERGPLTIHSELRPDIAGRDVLLVDDIFDTGHTLVEVVEQLQTLGPNSIRTLVLLRKHGRQQVDREPDFVGFTIPDEFVIGYGLDYRDEFRNLPYIAALETSELGSAES